MTEADFPGSEIVDALDARVDDSFSLPPHTELDQQFAEIIEAQKLIDEMESQLSDSTNLEPARKPGAAFITQGFVSGIETQLREHYLFVNKARFETHLPPAELPPQLVEAFQALIEGVKDDPYINLSVRVGRQAVRPFVILDNIATPARNPLQQGSSIQLLEFNPSVIRPHTETEHPRPHAHAGSYGAHLPVAWIGRILGDEGTLDLKSVKPRIGTRVTRDVSLDNA